MNGKSKPIFFSQDDEKILWILLFLFVFVSHMSALTRESARDDLAVLRASAYITHYPEDPLWKTLRADFVEYIPPDYDSLYHNYRLR